MTKPNSVSPINQVSKSAARWPAGAQGPDFFIVGAPKCGTTALATYLGRHREIHMSPDKELHYFGSDLDFGRPRLSAADYLSRFRGGDHSNRVGEASVWYLMSHKAAEEIAEVVPEADIIVMLRDPVDMVYSLHSQALFTGDEHLVSFINAWEAQGSERRTEVPRDCLFRGGIPYREAGMYAEQVSRYLQVFGQERVHIIMFEEFVKEPDRICHTVVSRMGLKPEEGMRYEAINANRRVLLPGLQRMIRKPPSLVRTVTRQVIPQHLRMQMINGFVQLNTRQVPRTPMSVELRQMVGREFREDTLCLGELIGRDLSAWIESWNPA